MDAFVTGAWKTPGRAETLIGGVWRRITRAEIYVSGSWRQCLTFTTPFSFSVTPYVSGSASPAKPIRQVVTTDTAYAMPVGGTAPFTYSWSASGVTINKPTSSFTTFTATLNAGQELSGFATVTCVDATGQTASGTVEYYLYNDGGSFS
jgi:hypothetical protein